MALERLEPRGGERAVDHAVIARKRDEHDALGGDTARAVGHGLGLGAADGEDARLRCVGDADNAVCSTRCLCWRGWREFRCCSGECCCCCACGALMIAVNCLTPNMPRFETVNVPPRNSSGFSLFSFAFPASERTWRMHRAVSLCSASTRGTRGCDCHVEPPGPPDEQRRTTGARRR